jgi:glycosyltransferase involved in cell wall biosynthesis
MTPQIHLAAFPKNGTAYLDCLYPAFEKFNIRIIEGSFSIKWAFKEAGHIRYFHFHWPSFFYAHRNDSRKTVNYFFRFLLFLAAIKLKGAHIFWTAHNLYPHDKGGLDFLDVFVRHLMVRLSTKIFVHGPSAHKRLISEFRAAKNRTVEIDHGNWINYYPNQIDRTQARRQLAVGPDAFIYLFIGICKEYKNLIHLVKTFQGISGDTVLLIAGKFQSTRFFRQVTNAARKDSRIRINSGFIENRNLQHYLNACDMVVLPYAESLTSGAAMLALSFGKPVIAPRQGNLIEMVPPSCGHLYDPNDSDGLKKAMAGSSGKNLNREDILNHARTFSWNTSARIFSNVLNALQ